MPSDELRLMYLGIIAAVLTFAAVMDYRTFKIKNALTVTTALVGIITRLAMESDRWATVKDMFGGFAFGFGVLFVLWLTAGGGAGDVKLMGAVGIWLGTGLTILVFLGSAVMVALIEMIRFVLRLTGSQKGAKDKLLTRSRTDGSRKRLSLPYAVPLSIVCWILFVAKAIYQWQLAAAKAVAELGISELIGG